MFSHAAFRAAFHLTERLEEANFVLVNVVAVLVGGRGGGEKDAYSTYVLQLKFAI